MRSPYVSRGGLKLEKALRQFSIDVKGKVALDVGASTGGFTHCLLSYGARQVYAVDVGYGQLDWKLRNDPRVIVLEKRNIRYLETSDLPTAPEIATIDVSFISLRLVLPRIKVLLRPRGQIIALIKPQFEVGKDKVGKGGIVRSHEEQARVIEEIKQVAAALGFTESPLYGAKGNKEFLIHLSNPNSSS
jgi:23S rRNA (cytidine1920-2'-O)/16S rRNA (cytidine1409-2'-O)-methyltransferase